MVQKKMNKYRSHLCSELSISNLGNKVTFSPKFLIDKSEHKCDLYLFIIFDSSTVFLLLMVLLIVFFFREKEHQAY